ncbi:hypothetical protein LIER_03856 [Lithospermum erythrorhizon]|uniref:RNase H type-1 domain-containing protein n=1 Tax=Lithospermum erythrorhizon TaxID=34254 RepID=A0AAV3NUN2_LITER
MPGIDPVVALHNLYVDPNSSPMKQKKRLFNDKKNAAIREEVQALLKAQAIRELKFPMWVANVVLVRKPNGKWRMCTDFTNLNKASLKDFYPLPCLGRLVDGSAGHEVFDFMDASRGSIFDHQIRMAPVDEEKTTFITEKLKAYFESHPVQVVTNQPLKRVLTSPALSGWLTTWAIELSEFEITYVPKISIRAQALADFITECTTQNPQTIQGPDSVGSNPVKPEWTLFVDGARNDQGAGVGVLIMGHQEETMEYALRFGFPATNNEAEY